MTKSGGGNLVKRVLALLGTLAVIAVAGHGCAAEPQHGGRVKSRHDQVLLRRAQWPQAGELTVHHRGEVIEPRGNH